MVSTSRFTRSIYAGSSYLAFSQIPNHTLGGLTQDLHTDWPSGISVATTCGHDERTIHVSIMILSFMVRCRFSVRTDILIRHFRANVQAAAAANATFAAIPGLCIPCGRFLKQVGPPIRTCEVLHYVPRGRSRRSEQVSAQERLVRL